MKGQPRDAAERSANLGKLWSRAHEFDGLSISATQGDLSIPAGPNDFSESCGRGPSCKLEDSVESSDRIGGA